MRGGIGIASADWVKEYEGEMLKPWAEAFPKALRERNEAALCQGVDGLLGKLPVFG